MSFANVQHVALSQGPLERFLGISNVRVQSAGGSVGDSGAKRDQGDSAHVAIFRGVENAQEIRDSILERLRRFREAGLGDPDDTAQDTRRTNNHAAGLISSEALDAAKELLAETRLLGATLRRPSET
jgi:uncharacterized membrane protein YdbT with pleckstrin-like domain